MDTRFLTYRLSGNGIKLIKNDLLVLVEALPASRDPVVEMLQAAQDKNQIPMAKLVGTLKSSLTQNTDKVLEDLHAKLVKLTTPKSPFPAKVKDEAATTWVRPSLVAEVKFAEWTSKGELRQPVYLGLRSDKRAKDVVRERVRPRK